MGMHSGTVGLKAPQVPSWLPLGLLIIDISFGGGKISHSLLITKSRERSYITVILINPTVVVRKLDFASETPGGLIKRDFWATLRVYDLIGLWWVWKWAFLTVFKGCWCCYCPSSLGESLFHWDKRDPRSLSEGDKTWEKHCKPNARIASQTFLALDVQLARRSRPSFWSLYVRYLPRHFAFLILIRCFLSLEVVGVNVPKHRFYWRKPDPSTITFLTWEFSLRSFISWVLRGEDRYIQVLLGAQQNLWEP